MSEESNYRGSSVRELPKANRTFGSGRVCAAEGCSTRLSVYNKWNFCWQHEPIHEYVPRGKRKRKEAA